MLIGWCVLLNVDEVNLWNMNLMLVGSLVLLDINEVNLRNTDLVLISGRVLLDVQELDLWDVHFMLIGGSVLLHIDKSDLWEMDGMLECFLSLLEQNWVYNCGLLLLNLNLLNDWLWWRWDHLSSLVDLHIRWRDHNLLHRWW